MASELQIICSTAFSRMQNCLLSKTVIKLFIITVICTKYQKHFHLIHAGLKRNTFERSSLKLDWHLHHGLSSDGASLVGTRSIQEYKPEDK